MLADRYIVNVEGAVVKAVMTLFIARAANLAPMPFWKSLGLPAFAVLSLPRLELRELVTEIVSAP